MERGRFHPAPVLLVVLSMLAPLPAQFAATAAEAAQASVRAAQAQIESVKQQQNTNLGQRQQLLREIQELQKQIQAVRMEKAKVLNELKQGLYCSQCNRSKSQLAADGIDFQRHLAEVNGRPVAAPPEVVAEVTKQFDQQIEALQQQIRNLQQRGKDLESAYTQLSIDLGGANTALIQAQQAVTTARLQAQMKQTQERNAESMRQLQQTLNGLGDLLVGGGEARPSAPTSTTGLPSGRAADYREDSYVPPPAYQPAPVAAPPRAPVASAGGSQSRPLPTAAPDAPPPVADAGVPGAAQALERASSEALRQALIDNYLRQRAAGQPVPDAVAFVDPALLPPPVAVAPPNRWQSARDQAAAIAGDPRRSMSERLTATLYGTLAQAMTGEVTLEQYANELEKNGKRIAGLGAMVGMVPGAKVYAKGLEGAGASLDLLAYLAKAKSPMDALTLQGASKLGSVVGLGADGMAWRSMLDGIKVAAQLDPGQNQDLMGAALTVVEGLVASRADQRLSGMLQEWKQRAAREGWIQNVRQRVYAGALGGQEYTEFLAQLPSRTKAAGEALADEVQRAAGVTPLQPSEYSDLLRPLLQNAPQPPKPSSSDPRK